MLEDFNWCQILGKTPESEMCRGSSHALCWFSAAAVKEVTESRAVSLVGTLLVACQHPQLPEDPGASGSKVPQPKPGVTP